MICVEETRLADPVRRDRKVAFPAALLQFVCNIRVAADAAVIKRQRYSRIRPENGIEMLPELFDFDLINGSITARETARLEAPVVDNIVVQQNDIFHAALFCRNPRKIPLSCSTFSSHDSRSI